jgi:2-oxoisovalerate dehydrogenase E2 component (dihydrolipoyl transacylase)
MGTHIIKVPDIGEGIAEVELVAWHVKPGDAIVEEQVLADVMTDKATVEIPSPVHGTVVSVGGEVGQVLAVGSELIRIEVAGEAVGAAPVEEPAAAVRQVAAPVAAPVPVAAPRPHPSPLQGPPSGPAGPRAGEGARAAVRPIASPSVRRRAWELGIDLTQITPTGTAGRIMHADLEAFAARSERKLPLPPAAQQGRLVALGEGRGEGAAQRTAPTPPSASARPDEQVPITGLRRRIAQKMQEAKRRIPHFSYVEELDVTEVEALRERLNAKYGEERGRLTLLPFLVRAVVLAVREFPQINARFDDEAGMVTRHGAVHVGIATQADSGLMVPVLRHAQSHDLWTAAAEIARLADAARSGRATREELSGSTITITSLGALGGIVTTPVINHPEVAIVGVNRIVERPMMRGGAVVARRMMNLSSSFDHRVVDGMHAAQFVQALRALLEAPAMLFVE